jgi:hypothetical protein
VCVPSKQWRILIQKSGRMEMQCYPPPTTASNGRHYIITILPQLCCTVKHFFVVVWRRATCHTGASATASSPMTVSWLKIKMYLHMKGVRTASSVIAEVFRFVVFVGFVVWIDPDDSVRCGSY